MGMVRGAVIGVAMRSVTGRVTGVGMGVVMGMMDMGIGAAETTGAPENSKVTLVEFIIHMGINNSDIDYITIHKNRTNKKMYYLCVASCHVWVRACSYVECPPKTRYQAESPRLPSRQQHGGPEGGGDFVGQ